MSILENQVRNFINYLSVERNLAKNSLLAYESDLRKYVSFLAEKKVKDFGQVSRNHITQFLFREKERKQETSSIARALVAIKLLHRFLVNDERFLPARAKFRQHLEEADGADPKFGFWVRRDPFPGSWGLVYAPYLEYFGFAWHVSC